MHVVHAILVPHPRAGFRRSARTSTSVSASLVVEIPSASTASTSTPAIVRLVGQAVETTIFARTSTSATVLLVVVPPPAPTDSTSTPAIVRLVGQLAAATMCALWYDFVDVCS
jgi:hypothetical protein